MVPYEKQKMEMERDGRWLRAPGILYIHLKENKRMTSVTHLHLSVDTLGDKRSFSVKSRFEEVLKSKSLESTTEEDIYEQP